MDWAHQPKFQLSGKQQVRVCECVYECVCVCVWYWWILMDIDGQLIYSPFTHLTHTSCNTCAQHTFTHAHTHTSHTCNLHTRELTCTHTYVAALRSVFPKTELGTFMALSKLDKEKQLKELTSIVTGIRLFNRDCGKGGEAFDSCESHDRNRTHTCTYTHSDVQCTGTLENYMYTSNTCTSLAPKWLPGSLGTP